MDKYKYPIYFEVRRINQVLEKKIQNYFTIRRKSDGGDCGPVEKVNDYFYKISFSDQQDQQRVLKKSEHVLELPDGPLVLTVCVTLKHSSPSSQAATPGLASQQSIPLSTLSPSGIDHELQFDTYILRYLEEECPKAWKDLQQELSSLGCSIKLHPDDGKVVILGGSAQAGLNFDQWKVKVENMWVCHYEVDPSKRQLLLQSAASQGQGDGVRVYSEAGEGFAVVVGGRSEVQDRLRELEVPELKGQGSGVKQAGVKTTLLLGEAKLSLLWEKIERDFVDTFPGMKVTHGDPGHLVLEGSAMEVVQARKWFSGKESLVQGKVASEISPCLLSFLRHTYGAPGQLEAVLGLGSQVKIELGDAELRVLTLSSDTLSQAQAALRAEFRDETIVVPECSTIPAELRARLESKWVAMNQGGDRVVIRISTGSRVHILGHVKEVQDLQQIIGDYLLDNAIVVKEVGLPSFEVAECLPQLLECLGLNESGVTFDTSASTSGPSVALSGTFSRVTQVQDRLGPALDSLVWERLVIDQPGALRYLQGPAGREALQSVGRSQRCLIRLEQEDGPAGEGPPPAHHGGPEEASYRLPNGLRVLVRMGDITQERADGLVNAANESLEHGDGVAAALSRAGGPEIQQESRALVRQTGKVPTGGVVVTTGGRLHCSLLIHAVGPIAGRVGARESALVEKTARAALDLAESMDFQSMAMPCISSGIFGIPIKVCAEAIVSAVREFGGQPRSVTRVTLIDKRRDVVRAMMAACDRLFPPGAKETSGPQGMEPRTSREERPQGGFPTTGPGRRGSAGASSRTDVCIQVEIVQGTIETQQVDALVVPMAGHDPLSSRLGNILSGVVGPQLTAAFYMVSGGASGPGDAVLVDGLPGLRGGRVFFLNCVPWDINPRGQAKQVLRRAIQRVLASCENNHFGSVAFPMLGTGVLLGFPHNAAAKVLLKEIRSYEQNRADRSPFLVRIVVHPNSKESTKALQAAQGSVHLKGFTSDAHPEQTSFYRYLSSTQNYVTALFGRIELQLVCGDIISETTDVIVNTTDFNILSALSLAIQTAAGPTIQAELAQIGVPPDLMCTTGPGLLGCREIVHARFTCDPDRIGKACGKILKLCESRGHHSVAFPAVNTGAAGMGFSEACKAMLDGMASTVRDLNPRILSVIRIVILQRPVYQAFKTELESRLGGTAPPLSLKERAKQVLKKKRNIPTSPPHALGSSSSSPQSLRIAPCRPPPALLRVVGPQRDSASRARQELESLLARRSERREVEGRSHCTLDAQEVRVVREKAEALAVSVELGGPERAAGVAPRGGAGAGGNTDTSYVLRGLREDVLHVAMMMEQVLNGALRRGLLEREEALVALNVQWSMEGQGGSWMELGLGANYCLENGHLTGQASVDVEGPDGVKVKVNLRKKEASDGVTGRTYKVKREEAAALPDYWDPMSVEEKLKKISLSPSSSEYNRVAQDFLRTAPQFKIVKIERVQSLYLWQAHKVLEQRFQTKNSKDEVGERILYHGTAAATCNSIEKSGFNRGYTNVAAFGVGVYFAVNASYSVRDRFSPCDTAGNKRMYVARVLTGRSTQGDPSMRVPPPRSTSDPHDCYDSVVDNTQQPTMFVVFHDDQAYPEYLVTFR